MCSRSRRAPWEVHPVEPELDRQLVVSGHVLVGDPAFVLLRVLLPGDQLVVDEGARTVLDRRSASDSG